MNIIAISGKAGSGKDTTALLLADGLEKQGKRVLIIHFADLLKFICYKYLGWDGRKNETGRTLLQTIGTNIFRQSNENYWVDFVMSVISNLQGLFDIAIIPDARFKNEITRPRFFGHNLCHVRVVRPSLISNLTNFQQSHSSEVALDNVIPDYTITNGIFTELEKHVGTFVTKYIKHLENES